MTKNQTLMAACIAGLVVMIGAHRKAGATVGAVSPQPGQQQRDNGLAAWLGQMSQASMVFTTVPMPADSTLMASADELGPRPVPTSYIPQVIQ